MSDILQLYKGDVFFFTGSPFSTEQSYMFYPDGGLVVENGKVIDAGLFAEMFRRYPNAVVTDYTGHLIMPGLIDAHVHYPQLPIIGMYGKQLIEWLNTYTFPAEIEFNKHPDKEGFAMFFLDQLAREGTTACMAWSTNDPSSVDALFTVATQRNQCVITGKNLMNRNASTHLLDTDGLGEKETRRLIERWHKNGRNRYAITPRFAPSSTAEQLAMAGRLHQEYADTYMQTHLSENLNELRLVSELFPGSRDYLNVYEQAGLLTDRAFFGHGIHLTDSERERISAAGATVVHCPTSNQFLGSGLFSRDGLEKVILGTDVGGGTSLSLWKTMGEAYNVSQLQNNPMTPLQLLYICTLGAAKAMNLADEIGSFKQGSYADFIVVSKSGRTIEHERMKYLVRQSKNTLENILFGLQILGGSHNIHATYINGKKMV